MFAEPSMPGKRPQASLFQHILGCDEIGRAADRSLISYRKAALARIAARILLQQPLPPRCLTRLPLARLELARQRQPRQLW